MLHPQQTFDSFIPGPANEFGHGAARAFAEGQQSDIPLLYIHGGFGFGKTHLLNAAALEFRKRGKRTLFLRAEDFMRHFLGALYRKDTLAFKEELRTAEVLIIDDLQHICRSTATASEFLYTVNAFADLRRRVVIAADRAPQALEGLGADVKSRLAGGLCIALDKPDRDTRLAILKARAAEFARHKPEVVLPETVLERIADLEDASPRELIGVFTKLATYADLTKKPVTLETAEEAVGLRAGPGAKTSIEDIQRKTAEFYKLDVKDFHSPQRARRVARPRQVAMYLSRKLTTRSLPEIGRRFGGRDHTTVLHACRRIEALIVEDPLFRQEVDFLSQMLQRQGRALEAGSKALETSAEFRARKTPVLPAFFLPFRPPFAMVSHLSLGAAFRRPASAPKHKKIGVFRAFCAVETRPGNGAFSDGTPHIRGGSRDR